MSWIHIDDLVALIAFLMKESTVRGVFNATSPFPVTNREFTQALAEAVHRPAILPVPAFALKLIFGEMSEVLLAANGLPDAAQRAGFVFQHPDIFAALNELDREGDRLGVRARRHVLDTSSGDLFFRNCMAQDLPRLQLEQVPLELRRHSISVALDPEVVIYVLQRGDKAEPVIAVENKERRCIPGAKACSPYRTACVWIQMATSGPWTPAAP